MAGPQYAAWERDKAEILPEVLRLAHAVDAKAAAHREEVGEAAFLAAVDKNQVSHADEGGKAELTGIDGIPVPRVVSRRSEASFLVLDPDRVRPDSRHLKTLIARQHFDAGRSRENGRIGRDVVLVWEKDGEVLETIYLSRPWMFSPRWWTEYAHAVVRRPTRAHVGLGTACAIMQSGLALCVAAAKQALDPGSDFEYQPAVLSAGFGMTLGIFVKTYKTWCLLGNKFAQITKSSVISLAFAYSLIAWTDGMASWDLFDTAFWLTQFHILSNAFFNNWAKTEWHQINRLREANRLNTRPFHLWLPHKGWVETEVSWSDIEHQAVYLVPFTLRLGDLTRVAIPFERVQQLVPGLEPLLGDGLPLGKALLYGSIPVAQYLVLKYAESRDLEGADRLRSRYTQARRRVRTLLVDAPLATLEGITGALGVAVPAETVKTAASIVGTKARACADALIRTVFPRPDTGLESN